MLQLAGYDPQGIFEAANGEDGLRAINGVAHDCLLLDMSLPDMSVEEFIKRWQLMPAQENSPMILLLPKQHEQRAMYYMDQGLRDYVIIEDLKADRLRRTIDTAIEWVYMARYVEAQHQQIERLTGEVEEAKHQMSLYVNEQKRETSPDDYAREVSEITDSSLLRQLEQQAEELKALYNASSVLFQSQNVLELSHQISQAIITEFKHFDCGVLLKSNQGNKLIRAVRAGEMAKRPTNDLFLDGPGLVPEAIRTNTVIYAPYVKEHPYYVENDSSTRSELVIPLRGMKGVLGVLDLQSNMEDAFSERDRRVLQMFAERAGAALEVVQLYEEQDQNTALLEFRVAQRTAEFMQSKDKVEAMFNSISDAMILFDASHTIEEVNPAFHSTFGFRPNDLPIKTVDVLFDIPFAQLESIIQSALAGGKAVRHELPAYRKDGSIFVADTIFSPLLHENFQHKVICAMRDMSLQKQLEGELRKALEQERELGEIKSRFTSMISHELRTPLAVILSTASLLDIKLETMSSEKIRERLKKIDLQVGRLTKIMDDVLTFSRAEAAGLAFQPSTINVVTLSKTIMEELASSYPHASHIEFSQLDADVDMLADESLIRHIVTNLLSNAIKYSPVDRPINLDLVYSNNELRINIRDYGIGIPEESKKHLFQSFHRATNVGTITGTGLGLAIVKKAVDAHGGQIRFESELGEGTLFEVVLPVRLAERSLADTKNALLTRYMR
ncbi:MAG: ATP-binding protein [Anaerolineae bacterium]